MTRSIVFLVAVLGFDLGCGTVAPTSTSTPDAGVPVVVPADAPPALDAPAPPPDAPPPTTWVTRFYDNAIGGSPEGPAWGWSVVGPSYSPITADPSWRGFVLATDAAHPRLTVSHPLVPRASWAVQVNYGWADPTTYHAQVGPRVQVADPAAPLGFRWESGFAIQIGASPGEALIIAGGSGAGVGWADGSRWLNFPEGDYAPAAQGTLSIRIDAAGNAEATVAGITLRHSAFHVGDHVVIGDLSNKDGADAQVVISLVVQWEPPGGVKL